jgi:formylglycine-generating enzyme required for sulfatase activity
MAAAPPSGRPTGLQLNAQTIVEFVRIAPGRFQMGSDSGDADQRPVHDVAITKGFELGKYEVTQRQWAAVMGTNPSWFKACGLTCPVENVSWNDVQQFLAKLNARGDGYRYRLPTEAEWEYAARAGTTGDYAENLDDMAWYDANAGATTHAVGQKQPNGWGLYDTHGNVWEWVSDYVGSYAAAAVADPKGPASGADRVYRGGSWLYPAGDCRSAFRGGFGPGFRSFNLGFRLVRVPS